MSLWWKGNTVPHSLTLLYLETSMSIMMKLAMTTAHPRGDDPVTSPRGC
jgi:hypothetical protein